MRVTRSEQLLRLNLPMMLICLTSHMDADAAVKQVLVWYAAARKREEANAQDH